MSTIVVDSEVSQKVTEWLEWDKVTAHRVIFRFFVPTFRTLD